MNAAAIINDVNRISRKKIGSGEDVLRLELIKTKETKNGSLYIIDIAIL